MDMLTACLALLIVQAHLPGAGTAAMTSRALPGGMGAVVAGTVRDAATNEPVPGADVALGDGDRRTVTGADGTFSFDDVATGPQHLSAARIGYASRTVHALVPGEGMLRIDIVLRTDPVRLARLHAVRGPRLPGVERGDAASDPDPAMTLAALRNHPLLAEPDAFRGIASGIVAVDPEAATGMHVRGGAGGHTAYLLDGVPVLSPYHAAGVFGAFNPDALSDIRLAAAAPSPALPDALSGTVVARTRAPGPAPRAHSAVSNTQARTSIVGPLPGRAGYLLSWRSNLPGTLIAKDESSYVRAETGDALARVGVDVADGQLGVLAYDSENEVTTGALSSAGALANRFEWRSRSLGAHYRSNGTRTVRVIGVWHARGSADATWIVGDSTRQLHAFHSDEGITAGIEHHSAYGETHAGIRVTRLRSEYALRSDSVAAFELDPAATVAAVYAQHSARIGPDLHARAGASVSWFDGRLLAAPRAQLDAELGHGVTLTAAVVRSRQFVQSLRNGESVAGQVFPADLLVTATAGGVPGARSDQVVAAVAWQAAGALRVIAQAYARDMTGIAVIAADEVDPFATHAVTIGRASASGAALDVAGGGARWGVLVSYGWQRVRMRYGVAAFAPAYATGHTLLTGLTVFPTATTTARVGVTAGARRSASAVAGPFEYESCNLLDGGCEFAGAPRLDGAPGGARLPPYVRIDVGVRQHWHVRAGARDHLIGAFATLTNVFGRRNVLTFATDDETGRLEAVEMVPRAPLVIGVEWGFR